MTDDDNDNNNNDGAVVNIVDVMVFGCVAAFDASILLVIVLFIIAVTVNVICRYWMEYFRARKILF